MSSQATSEKAGGDGATLAAVLEEKDRQIDFTVTATEKLPACRMMFRVTIGKETFESYLDEAIGEIGGFVAIPGFRKGKAPKHLVRARIAREARSEVFRKLAPRVANQLIESNKLTPASDPTMGQTHAASDGTGTLEIVVEYQPELTISDEALKDLKANYTPRPFDPARVDKELDGLRAANCTYQESGDDAVFEAGDAITVDIDGFDTDGNSIPGHTDRDYYTTKIAEELPASVHEQLLGKKKGDVVEALDTHTHGEGEHAHTHTVRFVVSVKGVKKRVLPALDDEFVKDLGQQFTSVAELRAHYEKTLKNAAESQERAEKLGGLLAELRNRIKFDVPRSVVERETQVQLNRAESNLRRSGYSLNNIDQNTLRQFINQTRDSAEVLVQNTYLTTSLGKAWNIQASEEEIQKSLQEMADRAGRKPLAVRAELEKNNRWNDFIQDVKVTATHDKLLTMGTFTAVEAPAAS